MQIFAFFVVSDSVEEPSGNAMSFRVIDDVCDSITLFFVEFSCSDSGVDAKNFADEEAKPSSNSFNFFEGKGNSSFSIDVGVENTMDMFEVGISVFNDE